MVLLINMSSSRVLLTIFALLVLFQGAVIFNKSCRWTVFQLSLPWSSLSCTDPKLEELSPRRHHLSSIAHHPSSRPLSGEWKLDHLVEYDEHIFMEDLHRSRIYAVEEGYISDLTTSDGKDTIQILEESEYSRHYVWLADVIQAMEREREKRLRVQLPTEATMTEGVSQQSQSSEQSSEQPLEQPLEIHDSFEINDKMEQLEQLVIEFFDDLAASPDTPCDPFIKSFLSELLHLAQSSRTTSTSSDNKDGAQSRFASFWKLWQ